MNNLRTVKMSHTSHSDSGVHCVFWSMMNNLYPVKMSHTSHSDKWGTLCLLEHDE